MQYIIRVLLVGALAAVCIGAFIYAGGGFELPFVERPPTEPEYVTADDTQPAGEITEPASSEEPTNLVDVMNPADLITHTTEEASDSQQTTTLSERERQEAAVSGALSAFKNTADLLKEGFTVSDGRYESYNPAKSPKYEYAWGVTTPKTAFENKRETTYQAGEVVYDYLVPRFGYIFRYTSSGYDVLDADTTPLFTVTGSSGIAFAAARDSQNRPIFLVNDVYCYYDKVVKEFQPSDYNPAADFRGILYDYPSYYGAAGNSERVRYNNGKYYGYQTTEGKNVIPTRYNFAYNFSEGIGVGIYGDRMQFLDASGNVLNKKYYVPEGTDKSLLGYYYFDHGLTRVLEKQYSNTHWLMYQTEMLVYKDFTPYELPKDYTLKAYSDGVMLLEKDGSYGYMNYAGDWIAQPIYSYAEPFCEGIGILGLSNGKKAIIDTEGQKIVPFMFDHISQAGGGVIALYESQTGWHILNKLVRER